MKSHKGFVPVVTLILVLRQLDPLMEKSSVIMSLASDHVFPFIFLPFTFVLPFLTLIVYCIRGKILTKQWKKESFVKARLRKKRRAETIKKFSHGISICFFRRHACLRVPRQVNDLPGPVKNSLILAICA